MNGNEKSPGIGDVVKLSVEEQAIAIRHAKKKSASSRKNGIRNCRISDRSDLEIELEGVASELAFEKLFNLFPDFSLDPKSSANGTDKGDCVWLGLTVDVKSTTHPNGRLTARSWTKRGSVRVYALMVGEFPEYEFRGFMLAEDLLRKERLNYLPRSSSQCYIAEQRELLCPNALLELLRLVAIKSGTD